MRRHLATHASELTALAADLYRQHDRLGSTALLTRRNWMAVDPVDLNDLELDWLGGPQRRLVDGTEPEAQATLPLRAAGRPFERYSSAVRYLDRPALFENRPTYRLLRVLFPSVSLALASGWGRTSSWLTWVRLQRTNWQRRICGWDAACR